MGAQPAALSLTRSQVTDHVSWPSDVYGPRLTGSLPVKVELIVETKFYDENAPNGCNTIAEIPGTDLASEIVLLGAHFDSHPHATGATDNATGNGAMTAAMQHLADVETMTLKRREAAAQGSPCAAAWTGDCGATLNLVMG